MGVPSFYRWLSARYPKVLTEVVEEHPVDEHGEPLPSDAVDSTKANPNGFEVDALYLDMNGIVHPCSHPEGKPAPESEEAMLLAVFEYIDRLMAMVRPRRLLYMALDGVAPRAKMNQQRSRRFRSAREARVKAEKMEEARARAREQGQNVPDEEPAAAWDSNVITPGTPFMDKLGEALRYYSRRRLQTHPAWKGVKVVLSDSNVPGEGEHKIMEFIRRQRGQPGYDANQVHVLYGLDADLIMLGLATHEPRFHILRELVDLTPKRTCHTCGQPGHMASDCTGTAASKGGDGDDDGAGTARTFKPYFYLSIAVLREYLEAEFAPVLQPRMQSRAFAFDLDRIVDDWVFMCFFVGNDFLPHLPSLSIRDGAIELLMRLYKDLLPSLGGYLTNSGELDLARCERFILAAAEGEERSFIRAHERQQRQRDGERRRRSEARERRRGSLSSHDLAAAAAMNEAAAASAASPLGARKDQAAVDRANSEAAAALRRRLSGAGASPPRAASPSPASSPAPSPSSGSSVGEPDSDEEPLAPTDDVRLHEPGWRERYYKAKFAAEVSAGDNTPATVAREYVQGLCWVLGYYYQGVPSWKWFYPYHYAPFASDCVGMAEWKPSFELGEPFRPFEQLMGVFPKDSAHALPDPFAKLMCDEDSPIADFYPDDFAIDMNGKRFEWQGVVLLPFINEDRLRAAVATVEDQLTEHERHRNRRDDALIIVDGSSKMTAVLAFLTPDLPALRLPFERFNIAGKVSADTRAVAEGGAIAPPSGFHILGKDTCPVIQGNATASAMFQDPELPPGGLRARMLQASRLPDKVLSPEDRPVESRRFGGGGGRGGARGPNPRYQTHHQPDHRAAYYGPQAPRAQYAGSYAQTPLPPGVLPGYQPQPPPGYGYGGHAPPPLPPVQRYGPAVPPPQPPQGYAAGGAMRYGPSQPGGVRGYQPGYAQPQHAAYPYQPMPYQQQGYQQQGYPQQGYPQQQNRGPPPPRRGGHNPGARYNPYERRR